MVVKQYYVYIMTNAKNSVFYTGMTDNLVRRVYEHKSKIVEGFTKRYQVQKLVYYEVGSDVLSVIAREKQIKSWKRHKKISMINGFNHNWRDLYGEL